MSRPNAIAKPDIRNLKVRSHGVRDDNEAATVIKSRPITRQGLIFVGIIGLTWITLPASGAGSDKSRDDGGWVEREWVKIKQEREATLQYVQGTIDLASGVVIELPPGFRYLDETQTRGVLHTCSRHSSLQGGPTHNAEFMLVLRCNGGMICRSDVSPLSDPGSTAILNFDDCGYVTDEKASDIDFGDVLRERQQRAAKDWIVFSVTGRPPDLIGFPSLPRYDAATHRLRWIDETIARETREHEMWHHACILGRRGVLEMTTVTPKSRLAETETALQEIMTFAKFKEGYRYQDYVPGTDKATGHGIDVFLGTRTWWQKWAPSDSWLLDFMVKCILIPAVVLWVTVYFRKRYPGSWWTRPLFPSLSSPEARVDAEKEAKE